MTFSQSVRTVLVEKYATFQGRASRSEYWWFVLFLVIVDLILASIDALMIHRQALTTLAALATVVPSLAVGCRRLHDTDRSGWWQLLGFVPLIGAIALLIFFVLPSDSSANRFGPPPAA